MKQIKLFLLLALATALSCTLQAQDIANPNGYVQVYDVASTSNLKTNKYEQYSYENDSVIIHYIFWASRGKMQVKIENKLSVPIYFNWSQSIYTVENTDIPLSPYEDKLNDKEYKIYEKYKAVEPTLTDMDYEWKKQTYTGQKQVQKDQTIEILPRSTYTKSNYNIIPKEGFVLDTSAAVEIERHNTQKNKKAFVYSQTYEKSTSPAVFAVDLAYSADKNFQSPCSHVKQEFYVSAVREMDAKHFRGKKVGQTPEGYLIYKFPERKSSRFYVEIDRRNSVEFNKRR